MTREEQHGEGQKSRPPYGGSALRASKDPAAPIGTAGHWMEGGDSVPLTPLMQGSSVTVVTARL